MLNLEKTINMNLTLGRLIRYLDCEVAELVDVTTPRRDGKPGAPGSLTEGEFYPVMGYKQSSQYGTQVIVINDDGKLSRYDVKRFNISKVAAPSRQDLRACRQ